MKVIKLNSRQLQARRTKERIFRCSIELVNQYGFENVTIEEISQKAKVSVGTFYHYYKSKREIYVEMFKMIDVYFEETVEKELKGCFFDKLDTFFYHYAKYNVERGLTAASYLYGLQNEFFLDGNRHMLKLLSALIEEGIANGQVRDDLSVADIFAFLMTVARGVIHDWILNRGEFCLNERMGQYIKLIRPSLESNK